MLFKLSQASSVSLSPSGAYPGRLVLEKYCSMVLDHGTGVLSCSLSLSSAPHRLCNGVFHFCSHEVPRRGHPVPQRCAVVMLAR